MKKELREKLALFVQNILKESKAIEEYKIVEFDNDEDLNFFVTPRLKSLKEGTGCNFSFLLYFTDERALTIYCPTVYRIEDHDSSIYTLNAINIVNSKIAVGKLYLNNQNSSIISYIDRVLFNDITKELTVGLVESYINSFLGTALNLYEEMKGRKR